MNTEERIEILEKDIRATKEELRGIIMDIRIYLMESDNPLQGDLNAGRLISRVINTGGQTGRG